MLFPTLTMYSDESSLCRSNSTLRAISRSRSRIETASASCVIVAHALRRHVVTVRKKCILFWDILVVETECGPHGSRPQDDEIPPFQGTPRALCTACRDARKGRVDAA